MATDKKVGRPKAIKKPEDLWQYFLAYMDHVKANPFKVHDFVGKDANEIYREKEKPLSMSGFESYVFMNEDISFNGVEQYFSNREGRYDAFVGICSRIRGIIRGDQIEGGMAGIFNASVTQRLNGLHEHIKQENFNPEKITVNIVKGKAKKDGK